MEERCLQGLELAKARVRKSPIQDDYDRFCAAPQVQVDYPLKWWCTVGKNEYPHLAPNEY
jgi:hypothetical protein